MLSLIDVLFWISLVFALAAYYSVFSQEVRPIAVKTLWGLQLGSTLYLFLQERSDLYFGLVSHVGLLVFTDMLWRDRYEKKTSRRKRRWLLLCVWGATLALLWLGLGISGKYPLVLGLPYAVWAFTAWFVARHLGPLLTWLIEKSVEEGAGFILGTLLADSFQIAYFAMRRNWTMIATLVPGAVMFVYLLIRWQATRKARIQRRWS